MLSVVIPAYNEEAYLGETLAALTAQLRPEDEVIVVDSDSADGTVRIAESHGGRVMQTPREGIGPAKMAGVVAARMPIVAFLDADGVPAADWVRRIRAHFVRPDVQAVAGLGLYGGAGGGGRAAYDAFARAVWWMGVVGYRAFAIPWLPVNNAAVRRETLVARGGYRPVVCEDLDFGIRARGMPGVVYDPSLRVHLSDRRFRSGSFLRQIGRWAQADIRVILGRPLAASEYGAPH